ncbi:MULTISPECIES: hypothetical protein [unclassified Synechocystis]|nr:MULTISPECIES: hypothetical protein [unclassified Synechocystis]
MVVFPQSNLPSMKVNIPEMFQRRLAAGVLIFQLFRTAYAMAIA